MLSGNALRLLLTVVVLQFFLVPYPRDKRPELNPAAQSSVDKEPLLEVGRAERLKSAPHIPADLKIISYNIRWRGGDELRKLIKLFRDHDQMGNAGILGLQEVDRNKKRTKRDNTVRLMAEDLGMHYAWTAPPVAKQGDEEATGVAILSPYPLSDIQRIVLPHEGPGGRRRVALGATVTVKNLAIRTYSVHSETRISVERKLEQMQAVLKDLANYPKAMPAVVLGDLNTWQRSAVPKTRKLFRNENFLTPFDDQATFYRRILFYPLKLKLDWIWLRNLEVLSSGIEKKISLSDHWPMWCVVKVKKE